MLLILYNSIGQPPSSISVIIEGQAAIYVAKTPGDLNLNSCDLFDHHIIDYYLEQIKLKRTGQKSLNPPDFRTNSSEVNGYKTTTSIGIIKNIPTLPTQSHVSDNDELNNAAEKALTAIELVLPAFFEGSDISYEEKNFLIAAFDQIENYFYGSGNYCEVLNSGWSRPHIWTSESVSPCAFEFCSSSFGTYLYNIFH